MLPQNAPESVIPSLLERYKNWITRHLKKMEEQRDLRQSLHGQERALAENTASLPEYFHLHGGGLKVLLRLLPPGQSAPDAASLVACTRIAAEKALFFNPAGFSVFSGEVKPAPAVAVWELKPLAPAQLRERLAMCLKEYARSCLGARLALLARIYGLPYARLRLGAQKSRWGSYSVRGSVSLNSKLIFLPPELADYIVLHELCHSRHLNHGPDYWALLSGLNPDAPELDRQMRNASVWSPCWFA